MCIRDSFYTLKLYNYIGDYRPWLNGWSVILNKEGIDYFKKKGMRQELFEELAENEKDLLKEIIEADNNNENLSLIHIFQWIKEYNFRIFIRTINFFTSKRRIFYGIFYF